MVASKQTKQGDKTASAQTLRRRNKKHGKRRSPFLDLVKISAFTLLLVYSVSVIISTQADIAEQKAAIEKLKDEITETQQENDEYQRLLSAGDEYEYMLSVAIERGYAYPRERRFYPKNNLE